MRSTVMAAAFAFHPRLAWLRAPFSTLVRAAGGAALRWLDQRRARGDDGPDSAPRPVRGSPA